MVLLMCGKRSKPEGSNNLSKVGCWEACLAVLSTISLPGIPLCPGTQMKTTGMEAEEHISKRICMCDMSG